MGNNNYDWLDSARKRLEAEKGPAANSTRSQKGNTANGSSEKESAQYDWLESARKRLYEERSKKIDDNFINSFVNDANKYLGSAKKDYDSLSWSNASEVAANRRETYDDLNSRYNQIVDWLRDSRYNLSEKSYRELQDMLDSYSKDSRYVVQRFNDAEKLYSGWETEEEYNTAKKNYEWQQKYKDSSIEDLRKLTLDDEEEQKWVESYIQYLDDEEKGNYDLVAGQKEIDDLKAQLAEMEQNKRYESLQQRINPAKPTEPTRQDIGYNPHTMWQQGTVQTSGISEEEKLRQLIAQKQQYLNQAKRIQESNAYADTVNNEDFYRFDDFVKSDDELYNWVNDAQFRDSYESKFQRNGTQSKYGFNNYDRIYENEIAIFNYYYAKGGKEAAQKYLDNIQETLNAREAGEMYGQIEGNTAAELVFGISAGVNQFGTNVMNNFKFKADYIPQSAYQIASGKVREDLADNGKLPEWLGGGSLGQVAYDAITTTANMAPSILVGMATGGTAGTVLMGLSAAGGAYQQALNEGFDKAQARGYSILVGASEAVLEKVLGGISPVGGNAKGLNAVKNIANADNALKAIAKRIGGSLVSEFKEEYLQEVLDPVFRNLMLHTGEDVKLVSYEAIYSGILGALTGAFMEAPFAIYGETKTARTGRKIKEAGSVNDLAKIGNTFAPETVAYKLAGKVTNDTGAYTIGQLFNEVNARLTDQNISEIAEVLVENDVDERTARQYAEAFAYVVENGSMPDALANAIEADPLMAKAATKVLFEDNTTWNQRSQGYRDVLMKLAEDKVKGKTAPTSKASVPADNTAEAKTESGAEGNVEPAKYGSIQNIKNGKVTVKMTDGTEVDLKDADLDPEDSVRIETIASIDGISAEDASGIFGILKAGSKNSQYDAIGAREAYRYGYYGLTEKMLDENGTFSKSLTPEQRKAVYEMGKKARDTSVTAETGKIKQMREAAGQKEPAKLRITYNQGNGSVRDIDGKTITGLSRKQRAAVSFAKVLHQLGVGTDFEFFESYLSKTLKDKNGNRARVFLDDSGNEVIAYSGVYQTADGKIRIDLNAYSGRGFALNAMSHELVHFIKQWSPDRYRTMADIVGNAYGNTQMSMHQRVLREQARLNQIRGTEVSYDKAYDEVVANALNRMLDDGTVLDRIAEIRKVDGGLADKMIDCIRKFIKRFAKVFSDNESLFYDTEDLMQFKDTVEELRSMFAEALVEASDNRISSTETDTKTVEEKLQKDYAREQYSSQETDRDRQQYNAFREKFAKDRLDSLSDKLGRLFPLSAGFEQAIQKDQTPVSNMTVVANSLKKGNGESYYTAAKNAFKKAYGAKTTFLIKQLGINADADESFARESISKAGHDSDKQTLLDLTPAYKQLIEESRLLGVERTIHNDNKKTSLLCYRLYNAYIRKEDYIDASGKKQTHDVPHIVVFNVVQNLNDAKAHMVTDIKDVAVRNGHNSSKLKYATHANGNISIGNIADVYDVVKSMERKKGGLRYSATDDLKYKFDYSRKNSGELYSTQETDNITARDLLSGTDVATIKNEVAKKKLADYQKILEVMNAEDQKLREIRAEIKELSFAKGARDTKKLKDLKFEAIKINNHISVYEGQLQRMEKELQSVVKRERAKVVKEAEKRDKAVLAKEWMDAQVKQNETLREYRETRAALRQQESDTAVMEKEFIRITKEYEKLDAKRGKTISELRKKLKNKAKKHRADEKMWMAEFGRLMREYEAADRSIDRLEQKIERQKTVAKERVEGRNKTAMRHKIQNVVKELNSLLLSNDKKRHVPDNLKKAVAEALDLVNMDTVGAEERAAKYADLIAKEQAKANPDQDVIYSYISTMEDILLKGEKMGQRLNELHAAYEEIQNSDDPDIANAYDPVIAGAIQELSATIGNTSIKNMSIEQLSDVYDVYRAVLTRVRDANKAMAENIKASIEELAKSTIREVQSVGGSNKYRISALDAVRKFDWDNLKPVYAMERIGSSTLTEVFNNVRAGEDVWARDVSEARAYYLEKSKKYGYDKWDFEKKYRFESNSGIPFELTLEQMMSLYAYSKREQAGEHLRLGGFVFDSNIETTKEKNGKRTILKYKVNTADAHQITPEIMADIIGNLTREQAMFVDEMQDYLSAVMGAKGNEVTSKMYGIKLFKEKFYFPLKSAKQFMFEQNEVSGEVRIKNSGFTNKVVTNANNPVILSNFMDVWSGHVNDMSMYHAFTLPLEDFNRVFNYNTPQKDGIDPISVKGTIQNAYSPAAVQYVKNLITDLNGGARSDPAASGMKKRMSLYKKSAVLSSMSVVVQQPSAIARAAALIDLKYFDGYAVGTFPKVGVDFIGQSVNDIFTPRNETKHNKEWEELKQFAPVALIKEMGYFDTNMGKSTQDYLTGKEYSGFSEKIKALVTDSNYRDEVLSKAPALADEVAWCAIWRAVKRETIHKHHNLSPRSEAFLKIAGERFTEVITKTQVYDSVLARSANMRSKDAGVNMLTAFMAEPTTSINMMADALFFKTRRGKGKQAAKTVGAVLASQIINAIFVSFVYAARDDDEDETYAEKYVGALTGSLIDGINPATYIPFIKDIISIASGYDVARSDMAVITDIFDGWKKLKRDDVSAYRKAEDFVGSIAKFLGLPVKNIMRDFRAIYNLIVTVTGAEKTTGAGVKYAIGEAITGKTVSNKEQLYEARMAGDASHAARVEARYDDMDSADAAVVDAIKDRFKEGKLDEATALKHLVLYAGKDGTEAHWTMDKWKYQTQKGTDEGYSKYYKIYEAIKNGESITEAVEEHISNGSKENEVMSEVKSSIGEWYRKGEITKKEATDMLTDYFDLDSDEIEATIQKWSSKVDTGISYDDIKTEYLDGNITSAQAIEMYVKYGGYTQKDAEEKIADYDFENEYGFAYGDRKEAYLDGKVSRSDLIGILVEKGVDREEAEQDVADYDFENEYGFSYSNRVTAYKEGIVSSSEMKSILMEHGNLKETDAEDTVKTYEFLKNHQQYDLDVNDAKKFTVRIGEKCEDRTLTDFGVSVESYLEYVKGAKNCKGVDADGDGYADRNTKAIQLFDMIDKLPISSTAKDGLAYITNAKGTINKYAPWHQ